MTKNQPQQIVEGPQDYHDAEEGIMVEASGSALVASAEIDMQIATARRYPRNLTDFRRTLTELVTIDEDVARSCIYVVPRDGKNIEGPSARFAELLVSCWGNNRTGGRTVGADDDFVTGQGFFFDLEKNTAITYEVKTSITKRDGTRFSHDMIGVAGSSAASKAHRNAALKGIPKALWFYAFEKAKSVVAGTQETLSARRVKMMKDLMLTGPSKEQIFGLIGVKGIDDITLEHMVVLGGVYTALKEGGTTVEEAFALDRMKNPDMVKPKEPSRSEFKKDDKKPAAAKKDAPAKAKDKPAPPAQKKADPKPQQQAAEDEEMIDQGDEAEKTAAREADRQDFIKDAYAELELQTKIIDTKTGGGVSPLRERVIEAGILDAKEQKAWEDACDAKNKAIMAAAKAAR
jgi:hypothetical protein